MLYCIQSIVLNFQSVLLLVRFHWLLIMIPTLPVLPRQPRSNVTSTSVTAYCKIQQLYKSRWAISMTTHPSLVKITTHSMLMPMITLEKFSLEMYLLQLMVMLVFTVKLLFCVLCKQSFWEKRITYIASFTQNIFF